jgi:hypothetical protein
MPPRSPTSKHILSRLSQAQKKDRGLTIRQAAREMGISESSIYKMRAGTRSGEGSIKRRVMGLEYTKVSHRKQVVSNAFNVTFVGPDGRVASRNIDMTGARTRADAMLMRHDPRIRKAVQRHLVKEAQAQDRYQKGSPAWKRREIQQLRVTEVRRVVRGEKPSFLLQYMKEE